MNTDMLCMNTDMLCMNIGMLCMNIGMLCMNIDMLCMHVGIVSSINAIDMLEILCMLNLTQITPHIFTVAAVAGKMSLLSFALFKTAIITTQTMM